MRMHLATLVAVAALCLTSATAEAQQPLRPATVVVAPMNPTWSYSANYARPHVYSYYASLPLPARDYVGLGTNDFPYYGRAYGSPSDPWSWSYMSNPVFGGALARYYYPPVR